MKNTDRLSSSTSQLLNSQASANPLKISTFFVCSPLLWILIAKSAIAQSIVPAPDGTQTQTQLSGNQYTITGGSLSQDGKNLFHSFQQFNLNSSETATFLSNPNILNILGRINGGQASYIDGLIRVTGGNSHLFLLNPSGILLGANAKLDVTASFSATTATGIKVGTGEFHALGSNNYANLVGNPNGYLFQTSQPGAIINAGQLAVPQGQNLTLLGGTVASTGSLSAPGGNVIVASVPGQSLVQLQQPGNILQLAIQPLNASIPLQIPVLSLPELLTGGQAGNATGLTLLEGKVTITGSGLAVETGDVTAKQVQANSALLSAQNNLTLFESQLQTTGDLQLLAQKTVRVRDSDQHSFLAKAGGNLTIQGNQEIDIWALKHPQVPFQSGGNLKLISDGIISGDAHFTSGGSFSILKLNGQPGTFFSYYDPIIYADGDVNFGDYSGVALKIEATGSITGGDITIIGADGAAALSDPESGILKNEPALILRAGVSSLPGSVNTPQAKGGTTFTSSGSASSPASINVGKLTTSSTSGKGGRVILKAPGAISTGDIDTSASFTGPGAIAGFVEIEAGGTVSTGAITTTANSFSGTVTGGNVSITSGGDLTVKGAITTIASTAFGTAKAGSVTLIAKTSPNSTISFTDINTGGQFFSSPISLNSGNVVIESNGLVQGTSITTAQLDNDFQPFAAGGTVSITHGGGPDNIAFTVGTSTKNGISKSIERGGGLDIFSGSYETLPNGGTAAGTPIGITINSLNTPPTLNPSVPQVVTPGQTVTYTYDDLLATVDDVDQDNLKIFISPSSNGGLLTINGGVVTTQTEVQPGDVVEYTAPEDAEEIVTAFDLAANDNVSQTSGPVQLTLAVEAPPEETDDDEEFRDDEDDSDDLEVDQPDMLDSAISEPVDFELEVLEDPLTRQYEQAFGTTARSVTTWQDAQNILQEIEKQTGIRPALIYALFVPPSVDGKFRPSTIAKETDQLEVIMVTTQGPPVRKRIPTAMRSQVLASVSQFHSQITNVIRPQAYFLNSQRLYRWLVGPLEEELQTAGVENLVFVMDEGLRMIPIAALHNGKQFIIERYSVGLMPSLSLSDTTYKDIRNAQVLAMGASKFQRLRELPAVPVEVTEIASRLWKGESFLNEEFTLDRLKQERQTQGFGIVHLATHANFKPDSPLDNYIQLWDNQQLRLDQLRQLDENAPPLDLLVLSACQTALGDRNVELGFAGAAVQAGVKSVMASLWSVSDEGTLGLMTAFYGQLQTAPIKAEALRQAQLAMLRGEVKVENSQLANPKGNIPLPKTLRGGKQTFLHPYFWASFTLIGNPW